MGKKSELTNMSTGDNLSSLINWTKFVESTILKKVKTNLEFNMLRTQPV